MLTEAQQRYRDFEHAAWERAAGHYADAFGRMSGPFAPVLLDAVGCTSGTRILEVASGPGHLAHLATTLGASACGVDFSAAMIAEAGRRYPSIVFAEADAANLPFPAEHFDAVVIGFGIHHFPAPDRAAAEAHRVLKAGGRFAFTVWSTSDNKIQQVLIDAINESGQRGAKLPAPPNGDINTPETCVALLQNAGFPAGSSAARKVEMRIPVPSPERMVEITLLSTVRGAALLRSQSAEAMPAIIESLRGAMSPYRRPDGQGYDLPAVAVLASARRE